MANTDLRRFAKAEGIPLWLIAEKWGISEPTMSRKMRKELPENEAAEVKRIIKQLAKEAGQK